MEKKLYKCKKEQKICGVCAGIAKYFSLDPTIVRLIFVLLAFTTSGVLAYIICALIMPDEPTNVIDA
ncbi:MAG: PspC domain-containing protein [Ruminococcaceae bacterium]|nr:PspC domain-containing protein [Oscillospiraceae bacterium]